MHQYGYWTSGKGKNLRKFFEDLARTRGLDPLLPSTWYQLPLSSLQSLKGGSSIKNYLKGGYVKALIRLFPNIGLDESKFEGFNFRSIHWNEVKQRRKGLASYATMRGFDSKIPENWYTSTAANISDVKVLAILQHYSGSIKQALIHLFPEIGLENNKFLPRKFWKESNYRRQFLENFAKKEGFDPLVPEHWYSVSSSSFTSFRGGREVLQCYNQNLAKAVIDLFPEINADEYKFSYAPKKYWQEEKHRRAFFDNFAKENGFDPLVPGNWYRVPRKKIIAEKDSERVLSFYNQSVAKALVDLYPDIGLDINKFFYLSDAYWKDIENRKNFFEKCARSHGVDPLVPENWYKLFQENKIDFQAHVKLLDYYNHNIPKGLIDVFPSIGLDEAKFKYNNNYWEDPQNRRNFFETFAKENNFDPRSVDGWFKARQSLAKESKGVLVYYRGNLVDALSDTFPELDTKNSQFSTIEKNYWHARENRKKWFENFAKENQFDPLLADNWYQVDKNNIFTTPGAREVLYFHDGRISRAISDLFPSLLIDKSKFVYKESVWKSEASRKTFFEDFAKSRDFDPLDPNNWYSITINDVSSFKSSRGVLSHYDNSLSRALLNLFPDIGLEENKFHKVPRNYWQDENNRVNAIKQFAITKKFDARCPEMWSPAIIKEFRTTKQGSGVLKFYKGSMHSALQSSFPDVHFHPQQFSKTKTRPIFWTYV